MVESRVWVKTGTTFTLPFTTNLQILITRCLSSSVFFFLSLTTKKVREKEIWEQNQGLEKWILSIKLWQLRRPLSNDRNQNSITSTFPSLSSYAGKSARTWREQQVLDVMCFVLIFFLNVLKFLLGILASNLTFGCLPTWYNIGSWQLPYLACSAHKAEPVTPWESPKHSVSPQSKNVGASPVKDCR